MTELDALARSLVVLGSEVTSLELGGRWGKHRRAARASAKLYAALRGGGEPSSPIAACLFGQVSSRSCRGPTSTSSATALRPRSRATAAPASACGRPPPTCGSAPPPPTTRLVVVDLQARPRRRPVARAAARGRAHHRRAARGSAAGSPTRSRCSGGPARCRRRCATRSPPRGPRPCSPSALRAGAETLPGAEALRDDPIVAALLRLRAEPEKPWELGELAAQVGMSRSALAARTTALLGEPLGSYLRRLRLERAAGLLATTDAPDQGDRRPRRLRQRARLHPRLRARPRHRRPSPTAGRCGSRVARANIVLKRCPEGRASRNMPSRSCSVPGAAHDPCARPRPGPSRRGGGQRQHAVAEPSRYGSGGRLAVAVCGPGGRSPRRAAAALRPRSGRTRPSSGASASRARGTAPARPPAPARRPGRRAATSAWAASPSRHTRPACQRGIVMMSCSTHGRAASGVARTTSAIHGGSSRWSAEDRRAPLLGVDGLHRRARSRCCGTTTPRRRAPRTRRRRRAGRRSSRVHQARAAPPGQQREAAEVAQAGVGRRRRAGSVSARTRERTPSQPSRTSAASLLAALEPRDDLAWSLGERHHPARSNRQSRAALGRRRDQRRVQRGAPDHHHLRAEPLRVVAVIDHADAAPAGVLEPHAPRTPPARPASRARRPAPPAPAARSAPGRGTPRRRQTRSLRASSTVVLHPEPAQEHRQRRPGHARRRPPAPAAPRRTHSPPFTSVDLLAREHSPTRQSLQVTMVVTVNITS